MDERGCLECLTGWHCGHAGGGELAQLFIDQRQQFVGGFMVALLDAIENARNLAHRAFVAAGEKRFKPRIGRRR